VNIISWVTGAKNEQEKRELREELTQKVMRFERRRSEVEKVSSEVMELMHRRRRDDPK
jgi:phenylpyruvate tautomerase PptA (4-oxalocrotonate tautomerase family)